MLQREPRAPDSHIEGQLVQPCLLEIRVIPESKKYCDNVSKPQKPERTRTSRNLSLEN